jgi:hypothetical protein
MMLDSHIVISLDHWRSLLYARFVKHFSRSLKITHVSVWSFETGLTALSLVVTYAAQTGLTC